MKLKGKRAIITGSSSGIGRAAALLFAAEGAQVVVNARGSRADGVGAIDAVVQEIRARGGIAVGIPGAVDDPTFAANLVECCVDAFGGVDILVNNAAVYSEEGIGRVDRCSFESWRQIMSVNLDAVFNLCRAALPHMIAQGSGRILNAGSFAGTGKMGGSAYSASKSALFGLTRAMAADYGPYGVTVNCYNPEAVSDMGGMEDQQVFDDSIRHWEEKGFRSPAESAYLLGLGGPEGIAPWLAYLCSDQADYINGNIFAVEARRIALLAWPEEEKALYRDAAAQGPWTLTQLEAIAPLAFPLVNRWPPLKGEALRKWEAA
ncbi:MAG: SDR family oxidoreductase [Caulobacterales bacterium]